MNHTPAPWIAKRDPDTRFGDDFCIGTEDRIDEVAVCSARDAGVIAAAPDVLSALRLLYAKAMSISQGNPVVDERGINTLSHALSVANAAIEKASIDYTID